MPSFNPAKPGYVVRASFLFSLGQCSHVFEVIFLLQTQQIWASCMHVFVHDLQMLVCAFCGCISSKVVKNVWSSGGTCGLIGGDHSWCNLQSVCVVLLTYFTRWVAESITLSWVPDPSCPETPSLLLFTASWLLSCANLLSVMGGVNMKWISAAAREASCSLSPVGQITGQGHLSQHWAVLPLRRGYIFIGKVKPFFFLNKSHSFLFQQGARTSSWTSVLPQSYLFSFMGSCQDLCFYGGRGMRAKILSWARI